MDKKYGKYIVIGWFISVFIGQLIRHDRQKKELEELEKINKLTEEFGNSLHESFIKTIREEISNNQAETDKSIKDTIEIQSETEKIFKGSQDDNCI